jgi:hypothetical protein
MPRLSRFGLLLCSVCLAGAATMPAMRQADAALARLPLRFEANQGQLHPDVRYAARAGAYSLALKSTGPSLSLGSQRIDISLLNSNRAPRIEALDPVPTRTDYFVGSRDRWRSNVPSFARVRYAAVYPGIDIVYYGNRSQLEYDFVLAPGADPRAIRMRFDGARRVALSPSGDLMVDDMIQKRPVIYQENPRREIAGRYILLGRNTVGVRVQKYDRSRQLVIDPVLSYLTYMGGTGTDRINAAKLHNNLLYVTGQIGNQDLSATGNGYNTVNAGGTDIFLAVIDVTPGSGYPVTYFTYFGGTGNDVALALDVDANGVAYITGGTNSADFPLAGAFQTTGGAAGALDAFVILLDPKSSGADALLYSTYLGGATADDVGNGIAVGPDKMVYVVGTTRSSDFPLTGSAFQPVLWGAQDAFIAKVDPHAGAPLVYSTYLGGEGQDDGRAILAGANGLIYFAASTLSDNFPMAGAQYRGIRVGAEDVIVGVMDLTKSGDQSLVYSTFFGGTGNEEVRGMAFDGKGNVIVTGYTLSTDLPVTADAIQSSNGGNGDAFVAVFNPSLTYTNGLLFSTYFGGAHGDVGYQVAGDAAGNLYVAGYTLSSDLPIAGTIPQAEWGKGTDLFVAKFKTGIGGRGAYEFSTYLGATGTYIPTALVLGADGTVYVTGYGGIGLPATDNAVQGGFAGTTDGFIAVLK